MHYLRVFNKVYTAPMYTCIYHSCLTRPLSLSGGTDWLPVCRARSPCRGSGSLEHGRKARQSRASNRSSGCFRSHAVRCRPYIPRSGQLVPSVWIFLRLFLSGWSETFQNESRSGVHERVSDWLCSGVHIAHVGATSHVDPAVLFQSYHRM